MGGYIKLLKERPGFALVAAAFFSLFFAWWLLFLGVDPSNESMLPRDDPAYGYLQEFRRLYGEDEFIVMAFQTARGGDAEWMRRIEAIAEEIRRHPYIRMVQSPLKPGGSEAYPLNPKEARRILSENPSYAGILMSADMRVFALLIWIEQVDGDSGYRTSLVEDIRRLAAAERSKDLIVHVAGGPVEKNDIYSYVQRDQRRIVPIIFALFAVIIFAVYRNIGVTLLTLGLVGMGLVWTLGFYSWMGQELNTLTGLLSPLIMIVTLENAVHFLNRYAREIGQGEAPETAMATTLDAVLVPCFLASLTTAGGLLTIAMLGVPAVQVFGLFAAAGVIFSFALSMSVFPVLVHYLVRGKQGISADPCPEIIRRGLERIDRLTAGRPGAVIVLSFALTGLALSGLPRLVVDTDIIRSLRPSAPLRRATEFIDRKMGGVNSLEIIVSRRDGGSLLRAKFLKKIARLQDFLEAQPEITKSISVSDTLSHEFQGNRGKKKNQRREILIDDEQLELIKQVVANSPLLWRQMRPWANKAFTHLRISARMGALGSKAASRLYGRIERFVQKDFGDILQAKLTGNLLLLSNMSNKLVSRQIQSLIFATLFVLILIGLLLRSVKMVLLSAIPNIIPICVVFGLMGWMEIPLSVPTAMIASISLGLVVDNTIHFLYSFQRLREEGNRWDEAVGLTLQTTGKPISISAVVLIGGFWAGLFGSFLPAVYFSVFMGLTILIAVLCDLILLPSILRLMRFAWEK